MHVLGHTPMLFTKPPAQKGAVHKIAPPERKMAIFDPLKMDGRADGNQKKPSLKRHSMQYFNVTNRENQGHVYGECKVDSKCMTDERKRKE